MTFIHQLITDHKIMISLTRVLRFYFVKLNEENFSLIILRSDTKFE